jgi:hypothetical protein
MLDERLDDDRWRHLGDDIADPVVASLFEGGDVAAASGLLHHLLGLSSPDALQDIPEHVSGYLLATANLPAWADADRLRRGQELFVRYGGVSFVSLICASLPTCYLDWRAALVLGETKRLEYRPLRRVLETAQFVIAVMTPGEMHGGQPPGLGVESIQRVRLMHASIRYLILHERHDHLVGAVPGNHDFFMDVHWETDKLGVPLNQMDLVYTLYTFSVVTVHSWRAMGLAVSQQQCDDYLHAWCVIGSMLGIHEALLPRDFADAERLFRELRTALEGRSDHGELLTEASSESMTRLMSHRMGLVRGLAESMTAVLMRQLIDARGIDILGVRELTWRERWLLRPLMRLIQLSMSLAYNLTRGIGPFDRLKFRFGRWIMNLAARVGARVKEELYELPEKLAAGGPPHP